MSYSYLGDEAFWFFSKKDLSVDDKSQKNHATNEFGVYLNAKPEIFIILDVGLISYYEYGGMKYEPPAIHF